MDDAAGMTMSFCLAMLVIAIPLDMYRAYLVKLYPQMVIVSDGTILDTTNRLRWTIKSFEPVSYMEAHCQIVDMSDGYRFPTMTEVKRLHNVGLLYATGTSDKPDIVRKVWFVADKQHPVHPNSKEMFLVTCFDVVAGEVVWQKVDDGKAIVLAVKEE